MFKVRARSFESLSTWPFCRAIAVLALLSASIDNAEPAPVNRFLCDASNNALPSLIVGLLIRVSYTRSPMVPRAARPMRLGTVVSWFRSSLRMAWRVIENISP
ncbi:hypothetical protein D9M71_765480 [compost metagenome]